MAISKLEHFRGTRMSRFAAVAAVAGLAACAALFGTAPARAHGDTSIPLFVAADGENRGDCSDAAAPCRSIGYALRHAGKGTLIRVAGGRYALDDTGDLFLVLSGVVEVSGGYDRGSGFARRSADAVSIVTGVPREYREALRERGFHVIADAKGQQPVKAAALARKTGQLLELHGKLQQGLSAGPCVGGTANGLACDSVDLLAHVPLTTISARPRAGNDVWGLVDLNSGREYAIAGYDLGTAVIDITDPAAPREVGFVDGQSAVWRDIKVYQHFDTAAGRYRAYAYVTTDGSTDGLFVIDLGGLPHRVARLNYPSPFSNAHNVYSTSTDFSTGLSLTATPHLIVAGSNLGAGQYRAYSLTDPAAPRFVPGSSVGNTLASGDRSYMHDAASLLIDDGRVASCANATTRCELLLDFNEEKLEIWDITDIADPQHLNAGSPEYAERGYVHSGWWSEDRQYAFVHDELDERSFASLNTTLRVFSLANLANPQLVGRWTGPTDAIDHNGYVRGNRYYMSNYSRGLTVLDISDPTVPREVGRLDTFPFSDSQNFVGAWGAFPFFPSGTIAVSDISEGLYLTADRSRDVPAGSFAFGSPTFGVTEGGAVDIVVAREGGTTGSVSVDLEVVHATADEDDYLLATATLTWADGEAAPRSALLTATPDGVGEDLEMLIVRLVNPGGGATLADGGLARVYVGDAGSGSTLGLFEDAINVSERGFGKAIVVVVRGGSAIGAASVDYSMTAGSAQAGADFNGTVSGTLTWADGDADPKYLEFELADDGIAESDEFFELSFGNAGGAAFDGAAVARITIEDGSGSNVAPNAVVPAGLTAAETSSVTLDGSGSNDPNGDTLSYAWTQIAGPAVTLSAATSAITTFTAPSVRSDSLLQFRLTVSDPGGLTDSATVAVTVTNSGGSAGGGSGGGAAGLLLLIAAAGAAACRRHRRQRATRKDAA